MNHWPSGTPSASRNLRADPQANQQYLDAGWWGTETLSSLVAEHASSDALKNSPAFIEENLRLSWRNYHLLADRLGAMLLDMGLQHTDRVVVFLPDSSLQHIFYLAAERAGLIVVGVGHRAGEAELSHLVGHCRAVAFISALDVTAGSPGSGHETTFERLAAGHPSLRLHLQVGEVTDSQGWLTALDVVQTGARSKLRLEDSEPSSGQTFPNQLGPSELFFLNSTSGTTGLPKCVMQTQNRWFYFNQLAVKYGQLNQDDIFAVAVPAPFGFGLWTTHFTPTCLGAPTIVMRRFSPDLLLRLIERERATVLCAVTTQFIMLLNSAEFDNYDLSCLRVLFTGGEAIPPHRAMEFEKQTGAVLLNFYGSNETGVLTGTRFDDSQQVRLTTGGRPVPEMNVRLYDLAGEPETATIQDGQNTKSAEAEARTQLPLNGENLSGHGQPACKGPATALGYYNDDQANAQLFTQDGWMLMGDVVRFQDGCLQVIGRTSDFIIRGGKNISAPAVEAQVVTHPAVRLAAAVAAPDEIFGERVAICVELRPQMSLTLDELKTHLLGMGVSKEWLPEYLFVFEALPNSSGGKVAKGELRDEVARRVKLQPGPLSNPQSNAHR